MDEFISREATIKRIKEVYCIGCNSYNGVRCRACGTGDAIDVIEDAPAADVAPVVHAQSYGAKGKCPRVFRRCGVCRAGRLLQLRRAEGGVAHGRCWAKGC